MEQIVRIKQVLPDQKAEIFLVRESGCSGDCHKCSGCGAAKETMIAVAENTIGAKPGDFVKVATDTKQILGMAMLVYVMPLVLFFAGYALGDWMKWGGTLMGSLGFVLGVILIVVGDRVVQKKNNTVYTITGYAPGQGPGARKGEHHHG